MTLAISGWRVTTIEDEVVAHGTGAVRLSWDGTTWVMEDRLDGAPADRVESVAFGARGAILTSGPTVLYSADGHRFLPAERGPDQAALEPGWADSEDMVGCASQVSGWSPGPGSIGPVLATEDGFVAFTPARPADWNNRPLCEPVPWFSADGSIWNLVSTQSPFGAGAIVTDVASRGSHHVAVGQVGSIASAEDLPAWAVWASDDGLTWERLVGPERPERCFAPTFAPPCGETLMARAAASDAGWFILDWVGNAWTSRDGRSWEPLIGWPGIRGGYVAQGLALSPDSIVVWGSLPGAWDEVVAVGIIDR